MKLLRKLITKACFVIGGGYPDLLVMRRYRKRFNKELDFNNPQNFNEKILWLIKNYQHPLIVQCADKYRLHDYVKPLGLEKIMPKVYGAWDHAADIDWDSLPNRFVIKCNHGAKQTLICTDKSKFDFEDAKRKLDLWLTEDYGEREFEIQYSHIKPLIFAEEYIEATEGKIMPEDYKIYCFNGEPKLVLVCLEREQGLELEWYDFDWNVMDIGVKPNKNKAKKPTCLEEMVLYAKELSKPFPFVRVDFYNRNGTPILGEMTFTPMYGMAKYYSEEGNSYLGSMLELPQKYPGKFV